MRVPEPRFFDITITEAIHDRQLMEHGGLPGVRDRGMLEAALARARHRVDVGLCPTHGVDVGLCPTGDAVPGHAGPLISRDPMERMVEAALRRAGIDYIADRDGHGPHGLDFHLPDHGVDIEVKRFHSDRISEQMARTDNVIALQGEGAIRFFCLQLERAAAKEPPPSGTARHQPD